MKLTLESVPSKLIENIPPPGLAGMSFTAKKNLIIKMQEYDPSVIYDTLRPFGDEFWNMIDGNHSLRIIFVNLCFEFDIKVPPEILIEIAEGLYRNELINLR